MAAETKETLLREILERGFGGDGSLQMLREKLAVGAQDWEELLRDGSLSGDVVRLGRAMAELYAPWVWASLLSETKDGSIPAMKLYFELCKGKEGDTAAQTGVNDDIQALRQAIFAPSAAGIGEKTGG